MSALNIPAASVVTNGQTIVPATLNSFPAAVKAWSTTLDSSNVGTAGFKAANIIPLNTVDATFGGNVGYTFAPGNTTQVPLTVSGVAGQSANIFQATQTSGGLPVLAVNQSGQTLAGLIGCTALALSAISIPGSAGNGDIIAQRTTSTGAFFLGGSVGAAELDFSIINASRLTLSGALGLTIPATAQPLVLGTASSNTTSGIKIFNAGGSTDIFSTGTGSLQTIAFSGLGIDNGSANIVAIDSSGNFAIAGAAASKSTGTAWVNLSDARIKQNIADYQKGLEAILALRPVTYQFNGKEGFAADGKTFVGYIAQDVEVVHPEMVTIRQGLDFDDLRGLDTSDVTPMLVNAVKALAAMVARIGSAPAP